MSNMEINSVLAQMRAMAAEIRPPQSEAPAPSGDFGKVMADAISRVNEQQNLATDMATKFQTGTGDARISPSASAIFPRIMSLSSFRGHLDSPFSTQV